MKKIKEFIKYNVVFYKLYRIIGSIFLRILGVFIKIDDKKILFVSFGGKKYDDSPKSLYEEMINMPEFSSYKFVWGLIDENIQIKGNAKKIKIDTLKYFVEALSSKIWITNVSIQRGLNFKKKGNIYINTWHGTPLKKIYGEENKTNMKIKTQGSEKFDLVCAQSEYDKEIFKRIFCLDEENIVLSDLPRNDELKKYSSKEITKLKNNLGIDVNKKIILYMPTFREYLRDSNNNCIQKMPINLQEWEYKLGAEYVILFRAHYLIKKNLEYSESDFFVDVSDYSKLNDLYAISDCLISDYSSAFFDYAILEKPMFCFAYDLEEYNEERGLYLDIYKELPCSVNRTEQELIEDLLNISQISKEKIKEFKDKYTPNAGNATNTVLKKIIYLLNERKS